MEADDVIDLLAFVHLVEMRFDGEVVSFSRFRDPPNGIVGSIEVQFGSWENWDAAKYHCGQNLERGHVTERYVGALDRVDPGKRVALSYLANLKKQRLP